MRTFVSTKEIKVMESMTKVMSFDKIETKADVLKYALEFTAENGKPNYDEARKMFEFFTSLVSLPDSKEDRATKLAERLTKDLFGTMIPRPKCEEDLQPETVQKKEEPVFEESEEF